MTELVLSGVSVLAALCLMVALKVALSSYCDKKKESERLSKLEFDHDKFNELNKEVFGNL